MQRQQELPPSSKEREKYQQVAEPVIEAAALLLRVVPNLSCSAGKENGNFLAEVGRTLPAFPWST
jgi:hypothetical protein